MDLWIASQAGGGPGGSTVNLHTKTAAVPQVTLHLDVHPPVLDTSGLKQTPIETIPKPVGGSKKVGGFGGQWLNSLRSMYHTLRSGTTPVTWVTPEALIGQQPALYELFPQSHYRYNVEASRMYEPNSSLWYPALPEGSQLGYLDPLMLWENPCIPYSFAPQPCNSQVPHKSKVDQPLNPEAKEWIPRDYIKDYDVSPSSPSSKKTSEVECLKDKVPFIPKQTLDPLISDGCLDFCEITDSEVDAVRLSESSSSVDSKTSGAPQVEKEGLTDDSSASHVDAVCNSESVSFVSSQDVGVLKVEKERLSLNRSERHAVVVPVASVLKHVPSIDNMVSCDSRDTEVHNCDSDVVRGTSTFSYASIVGKTAIPPTLPTNTIGKTLQEKSTGTETVQQPIPRIFLKDKKYPKEKAAPSVDNNKNPVLFKSVNKNQKKCSRNFLKELRESSPVKVGNSDPVGGALEVGSSSLEFSSSPSCLSRSPVLGESPVIASPKDKLACSLGSPLSTILRAQHSVSESSSNSSHVRSTSESSIASVESIEIEFGEDVGDRSSAAPDVFVLTEKCQPETFASPEYSSNIVAHILGCDDSESESTDDESEDSDSDWDNMCADSLVLDDTWETFGLCVTPPESTKIQKSPSSPQQDFTIDSSVKLVCDTVSDEDSTFTEVTLEEINKRWEQEVENDVIGISESKVNFGEVTIHPMIVWAYACKMARRGPWEEYARDRVRFSHRIATVEPVISSILQVDHRERVYQKLYGQQCRLS